MEIFVVTEGATERQVGKVLYEREVLSRRARPRPRDWKSIYGQTREGYEQVVAALKGDEALLAEAKRLLLVFDQESSSSPATRAAQIAQDLHRGSATGLWQQVSWNPVDGWENLFECRLAGSHVVLHISDAAVANANRHDFDGYILRLLRGPHKLKIAAKLVPEGLNLNPQALLQKAEREITQMMERNGFPWTHNKSWLYAYITAFQFRQSHVGFAKEVVKSAPASELRQVFASLIAAWNLLIQGDDR